MMHVHSALKFAGRLDLSITSARKRIHPKVCGKRLM